MTGVRRGVVVAFDAEVGLGRVSWAGVSSTSASTSASASGGSSVSDGSDPPGEWEFHCTQIAGGSRSIEVGTPVSFSVRAGRLGRWEAVSVTPA
ncbi:MAG TPA: hypothetical protein VFH70_10775 [Acidimicrobiales bacterium]|nr:hypothetical protein [Acidimicrobiales bacterium]